MTRVRYVKIGKQWKTICHVPDTMDADLPKGALVSKSSVLSTGIPPWHHGIMALSSCRAPFQGDLLPRQALWEWAKWQEYIKVPYYVCRKNRLVSTVADLMFILHEKRFMRERRRR